MPEMLSQPDAGVVHGLASDVDNMRRELSQVREIGKQLEQWRKEIAPLQRLAGELRGLISEAKGFGSIELTVKELRQQMAQCLYTDKRVDDLWKSLHERTDHATVYTANLSIAQDKRIDELFEKVEELNSFIDNDDVPLALVQLSNRVSQLEGNVASAGLAEMTDAELNEEVCDVLSGVLNYFDGDTAGLDDVSENRVKGLLSELRSRN